VIRALNLPAAIAAIIAICAPAQAATFLYSGTLDSYSVSGSGLYGFTVAGRKADRIPLPPLVVVVVPSSPAISISSPECF
jgi:hypothetical protein